MGGINPMLDSLIVKAMMASPFMQEFIAEVRRRERADFLLTILEKRFGSLTPTIESGLEQVEDYEALIRLTDHVVTCSSLQEFEESLHPELFDPATGYPPSRHRS